MMVSRWFLLAGLAMLPGDVALAEDPIRVPEETDAVITTTEDIHRHEGRYQQISSHEEGAESIDAHEGKAGELDTHEGAAGEIANREASAGQIDSREVNSERLTGVGKRPETPQDRLEAAREKLLAARERHSRHEALAHSQAPASAAPDLEAPAASEAAQSDYGRWTSRLDVARHRIDVAQAVLEVWDKSYAEMLQDDYPRGEARQKLIDSRDKARERLAGERARLPRLVEAAREAGVPQGILQTYALDGS